MILCRVVCALEVTMDSFCFRMAFKSVLLPEFGFPTIATYPAQPDKILLANHAWDLLVGSEAAEV